MRPQVREEACKDWSIRQITKAMADQVRAAPRCAMLRLLCWRNEVEVAQGALIFLHLGQ